MVDMRPVLQLQLLDHTQAVGVCLRHHESVPELSLGVDPFTEGSGRDSLVECRHCAHLLDVGDIDDTEARVITFEIA